MAADNAKPATDATKAANAAVLKALPFNNKQAFEDAKRGFIAPLENNGAVKNAKGDLIWDLPKFDFLSADKPAPDTVNPSLWRQAQVMQHYTSLFEVTKGIYQWVMQVLMHVVYADPGNMEARNLLADASEQFGYQAEAGTWRGWYLSAAKDLREGVKPLPVVGFVSPDTVAAMPLELFFDYLSIRLNGPKAEGKTLELNLDFPDTKDKYLLVVQYGVLQYHKGRQAKDADVSLTLDRATLDQIIEGKLKVEQGITNGKIKLDGESKKFEEFIALLDKFDPWYQVVMPVGTK